MINSPTQSKEKKPIIFTLRNNHVFVIKLSFYGLSLSVHALRRQSLSHLVDARVLLSVGHVRQQFPLLVIRRWRSCAPLAAGAGELLEGHYVEGSHAGYVTSQLIVSLKHPQETFHHHTLSNEDNRTTFI